MQPLELDTESVGGKSDDVEQRSIYATKAITHPRIIVPRQLLSPLGGAISVESRVGEGSVFEVWLPQDCEDARTEGESAGG